MPVRKRRQKGIYEDILEERRQRGEVGWLARTRRLPRYRFQAPERTPAQFQAATLSSDRVQFEMARLAEMSGRPLKEVKEEAEAIMVEMGHALSVRSVKAFGFFLAKVMKRLYRGVFVNSEGIMKLRSAVKDSPVVLLPSHRSYADFLLMSFICFDYDIPLPVIAAAMDFASMKFFGNLLRRCGAFFIRRSFATDPLYWLIFTEFVRCHLRSGQHPIEFFLEGTRSRTGKSLMPKTGMLGAILESWFLGEVSDVLLVPVSISYDRILEDSLYAYELLGIPKPKESTSGLLKARGILEEDFGNVHFFIHDPISLRSLAEGQVDRSQHNLQARFSSTLLQQEMDFLKSVAFTIVGAHQRRFVISPWCLIALLVSQHPDGIPTPKFLSDLEWLRNLLRDLGGNVDWPDAHSPEEVLKSQTAIHPGILQEEGGRLCVRKEGTVMEDAARYLQLVGYRNNLMHCLVTEAILSAAVMTARAAGRTLIHTGQLREEFTQLHDLLRREFVLDPSRAGQRFEEAVGTLARLGALSQRAETVDLSASVSPISDFLARAVLPFLAGYHHTASVLLNSEPPAGDKEAARAVQAAAFAIAERGELSQPDILSLDLLTNAVSVLRQDGFLRTHDAKLLPDATKLKSVRDRLNAVVCAVSGQREQTRISKL